MVWYNRRKLFCGQTMKKSPRGFKGKYFTLAAIQAMASECKLHSQTSRAFALSTIFFGTRSKIFDENDDPLELELAPLVLSWPTLAFQTPCHCGLIFAERSRCALKASRILKKICPCRKRKSGLSPPSPLMFRISLQKNTKGVSYVNTNLLSGVSAYRGESGA